MTTLSTLFFSFLCFFCVGAKYVDDGEYEDIPAISFGYLVDPPETAWHVGLYKKTTNPYSQICGGTIITKRVVITAAHCFTLGRRIPPASDFAVAAGKLFRPWHDSRDHRAQKLDVVQIHIPARYQGSLANFQDDIALIVLERELIFNAVVGSACLSFDPEFEEFQLAEGKLGKVVGWGLTGANDRPSSVLQGASMPIVNINECIEESPVSFRSSITSDKICAGNSNGTAVCRGDSGGGLMFTATLQGHQQNFLYGIVSTSPTSNDNCNIFTWATFTHVSRHERFIKSLVPDVDRFCFKDTITGQPDFRFGETSCNCTC